jgi:hypothetical protein
VEEGVAGTKVQRVRDENKILIDLTTMFLAGDQVFRTENSFITMFLLRGDVRRAAALFLVIEL